MRYLRRPIGSIVGRSDDVRAIRRQLEAGRLVDLVGPGGVGKTTLAAEVAHELEPDFARVVIVELADARHAADVLRLTSTAVLHDASLDIDRVAVALDAEPTLLVVDNCEHLVEPAAEFISDVLSRCVELRVLATSRRPLNIAGEISWPVTPLGLPEQVETDADLTSAAAVQLFLERVRQVDRDFELTDTNRAAVANICAAADGVPLVLELAAALVRSRSLDEILAAMTGRPETIPSARRDRPQHQRSLASSLDWSRQFLDEADAALLSQLAVFVGGFTAEGARAIGGADAANGLSRLVDHSLLMFDQETGRYRMLDIVRIDAEKRLSSEERDAAESRNLAWCKVVVKRIDEARFEPDPDGRFLLFDHDLANLCATIRRCYDDGDADCFRELLGPIAVWWVHLMPPDNPEVWLSMFDDSDDHAAWRANVGSALAFYWSHRADHEMALGCAETAADGHRYVGDLIGESLDRVAMGNAHASLGAPDMAAQCYGSALQTAVASGHPYPELIVRVNIARLERDDQATHESLSNSLPIARRGFPSLEAVINAELGLCALREGRIDDARRLSDEAVEVARENGFSEALASSLCARGDVAVSEGQGEFAWRCFSEALGIGRRVCHEGIVDRAMDGLDAVSSRHGPDPVVATASEMGAPALSERELSVARLLRGDLTQREIADELYIAPSTVKTHIKSIYRKLDVNKRSHAVTRSIELGLFGGSTG